MPEISRFYGIVVYMYFGDHSPPHIHVRYAEWEAQVGIDPPEILHGRLPGRAWRLVSEWASLHTEELHELWERAQDHREPGKIDPLM